MGDRWRNTKSLAVGTLLTFLRTRNLPCRVVLTRVASSYLFSRWSPTLRKGANCCQHVINEQEPLTPWHLHVTFMFWMTAYCKRRKKRFFFVQLWWYIIQYLGVLNRCLNFWESTSEARGFCYIFGPKFWLLFVFSNIKIIKINQDFEGEIFFVIIQENLETLAVFTRTRFCSMSIFSDKW